MITMYVIAMLIITEMVDGDRGAVIREVITCELSDHSRLSGVIIDVFIIVGSCLEFVY